MQTDMKQTNLQFLDRLRRTMEATILTSHEIDEGVRRHLRDLCRLAAYNGYGAIRVNLYLISELVLFRRKAKWDSDIRRSYFEAIDELHDSLGLTLESEDGNKVQVLRWNQGDVFPLLDPHVAREALGIDQWSIPKYGFYFRHVPMRKEELA